MMLMISFTQAFSQSTKPEAKNSSDGKKYATLGQDDQTAAADQDGLADGELPPSLSIFPFQWVDLTEPSKEAKTFSPEADAFFKANSTEKAVDTIQMDMTFLYIGEK